MAKPDTQSRSSETPHTQPHTAGNTSKPSSEQAHNDGQPVVNNPGAAEHGQGSSQSHSLAPVQPPAQSTLVHSPSGNPETRPQETSIPNHVEPGKVSNTHTEAPPARNHDINNNPKPQTQDIPSPNRPQPTEALPSHVRVASPTHSSAVESHVGHSASPPQETSFPNHSQPAKASNTHFQAPPTHSSDTHSHNNNPDSHSQDTPLPNSTRPTQVVPSHFHTAPNRGSIVHLHTTSNSKFVPQETPPPDHSKPAKVSDPHTSEAHSHNNNPQTHSMDTQHPEHSSTVRPHASDSKSRPQETSHFNHFHPTKAADTHTQAPPTHSSEVHSHNEDPNPHSQKSPPNKHGSTVHSHTSSSKSRPQETSPPNHSQFTKASPSHTHPTHSSETHSHDNSPPSHTQNTPSHNDPAPTKVHQSQTHTASPGNSKSHHINTEPSRLTTKAAPIQSHPAAGTDHSHAQAPPQTSKSNHKTTKPPPVATQTRQTSHPSELTTKKPVHSPASSPLLTTTSQNNPAKASTTHTHSNVFTSHGESPPVVSHTLGSESHSSQQIMAEPTPSRAPIVTSILGSFTSIFTDQSITAQSDIQGPSTVLLTSSSSTGKPKELGVGGPSTNVLSTPTPSNPGLSQVAKNPSSSIESHPTGGSGKKQPPPHSSHQGNGQSPGGLSKGETIGICIAVVVAILLVALIIFGLFFYRRKHRKLKKELLRYQADRNMAPPVYVPDAWRSMHNPPYSLLDTEGQVHHLPGSGLTYPSTKEAPASYRLSHHPSEAWKTASTEKDMYSDFDNVATYRFSKVSTSDQHRTLASNEMLQPKVPLYHPPHHTKENSETTVNSLDSRSVSSSRADTLDLPGQETARMARSPTPNQVGIAL